MSEKAIVITFFVTFFIFILLILLLASPEFMTEPLGW